MNNPQSARPQSATRIVIIGFMGAGKTTIARTLAQKLNCVFVDLDEFIKVRYKRTPQQIIDEDGEANFREIESDAWREVLRLAGDENVTYIISLGGGTWTLERNRALIAVYECLIVWLDAPFELCWARITREDASLKLRPFARDRDKAFDLYTTRRKIYAAAAHRVIVDETKNVDEIVTEIINFAAMF
ncbi:MAG: shikimate kinase [Pyrinomonadaceae bacterium]